MDNSNEHLKKRGPLHHIFTVIGTILCVTLIPVLIINLSIIFRSYLNPDEMPTMAGYFPLIVLTDSMDPEISSGDLVIYHTIDPEEVETGDVIAFYDPAGDGLSIVTHRVIDIVTEDGETYFQTKGDANDSADEALVPSENIAGCLRTLFPGAGYIALFFQSRTGIMVCVVIPLIFVICYDFVRQTLYDKKQKEDTDALLAELNELRARREV